MRKEHNLIVISGPTAVGKTSTAIKVALNFDTSVLSADSRQIYRETNIGTAKPSSDELALVPHYFIGHISIDEYYNAYRFGTDALLRLESEFSAKNYVVLTGGSGLYIDAVTRGIDELPDQDQQLRQELKDIYENHGIGELKRRLSVLDPVTLGNIDQKNPSRLIRALEICLLTGKKASELRSGKVHPRPFNTIKIGISRPKPELDKIINERVDTMLENGLLEEVRGLLPYRHLNSLNTLGYRELFDYLDGKSGLDEAVDKIKTNTRRFAKRQMTWFKKDTEIRWFHPDNLAEIFLAINSE